MKSLIYRLMVSMFLLCAIGIVMVQIKLGKGGGNSFRKN